MARLDFAIATFRLRYAPPPAGNGEGGNNALAINPDHSVGADQHPPAHDDAPSGFTSEVDKPFYSLEIMMAEYLKRGATAEARANADRKVREVVETTLAVIEKRGNVAVRDLSIRFDGWSLKRSFPCCLDLDGYR